MQQRTLDGATALVTGAARGVGRGIALALARAGCRVAINDLSVDGPAGEAVAEAAALGVDAVAVAADVRSASGVDAMIDTVVRRFGRLDILVNNAGIQTWKAFLDVTETEWDAVVDTNLKGTFLCTQAAARHMKDHGGGSIVNIGSGCNWLAFPKLVAYTASKGGVEMLTKVSALELGQYGIRVNCVAPGAIETERTRREAANYGKEWGALAPAGRAGTPEDIGRMVVFLASGDASFVTGHTIAVDGGLFCQSAWIRERP
jgi:NAD(P)-dependent dehydrogenase (short-subunit alcohol dehydrogenase family)